MPARDNEFGMRARLQARHQADWEQRIAAATHSPDEVIDLQNFAIDAQPCADEPGAQELVLVLATGRQYKARVRPESARAVAEKLLANATLDPSLKDPES